MQKQFSFYKNYELIDCGDLRRLERFGEYVIDRPAKQATFAKKLALDVWDQADAVFDAEWSFKTEMPSGLVLDMGLISMELRFTASGQLGIFPEQALNWEWLLDLSKKCDDKLNIMNGFAYTGGSTLFSSLLGEVCHVDGSRTAVKWASDNLKLSKFKTNPVRWIVDDVLTYMNREIKRGKKYNGFIMDPPAFGRGKDNKAWSLKKDIFELVQKCNELSDDVNLFILSAHDPEMTQEDLKELLLGVKGTKANNIETLELNIASRSGNALPCGVCARFKNC